MKFTKRDHNNWVRDHKHWRHAPPEVLKRTCPGCHAKPGEVCSRGNGLLTITPHWSRLDKDKREGAPRAGPRPKRLLRNARDGKTYNGYPHATEIACATCNAPVNKVCVADSGFNSARPHTGRQQHGEAITKAKAKEARAAAKAKAEKSEQRELFEEVTPKADSTEGLQFTQRLLVMATVKRVLKEQARPTLTGPRLQLAVDLRAAVEAVTDILGALEDHAIAEQHDALTSANVPILERTGEES